MVTWTSDGQDGSGSGVYQRVFHLQEGVAPSGADRLINVEEDGSHTFSAADFGFSDSDGNNNLSGGNCHDATRRTAR